MGAYKDAIAIDSHESGARLHVAAEVLSEGSGVVVLGGVIALRSTEDGNVSAEVIASPGLQPEAYRTAVASAKQLLSTSTLASLLSKKPAAWVAVHDYGMGCALLWTDESSIESS